jgi:hypothetical protein
LVAVALDQGLNLLKAHLVEILYFHQLLRLAAVVAVVDMTVLFLENKTV